MTIEYYTDEKRFSSLEEMVKVLGKEWFGEDNAEERPCFAKCQIINKLIVILHRYKEILWKICRY